MIPHPGDPSLTLSARACALSPEQRLIRAVIRRAARDVLYGSYPQVLDAMTYFRSRNFEDDCDGLGLEPDYIRRHIQEQLTAMPRKLFTEDQLLALHRQYVEEELSLAELARRHNTSSATLSRYFAQAGLPIRPRGATTAARYRDRPAPPAAGPDALRQLSDLIANLDRLDGRGAIRLTLTLDLTVGPENPS